MKHAIFATSLLTASLVAGATFAHGKGCHDGPHSKDGHHRAGALFTKTDKNGDQKIDRAEAKSSAKERFVEMDENKNQIVTPDEARAAFEKKWAQHRPSPEQQAARFKEGDKNQNGRLERSETKMSEAHFAKIDQNNDGALTLEELRAAKQAHEHARKEKAASKPGGPMFAHLDKNQDGQITAAENEQGALLLFDAMDHDKDGFVTRQEARASFKKHHKKGPAAQQKATNDAGTTAASKK